MILFITRKYPPSIGGMQRFSYKLANHLARRADIQVISWGKSQLFLPFFLPVALFRAMWTLSRGTIKVVHLGDCALSPIGVLLKILYDVPLVVSVHGRDLVFPNRLYQHVISRCLKGMDKVICVSEALRKECIERGICEERCEVIPNGVDIPEFDTKTSEKQIQVFKPMIEQLRGRVVLLTVGRLVEKKGIHHFVEKVLPRLLDRGYDVCYIVVGNGPFRGKIEGLIKNHGLEGRVFLLGEVPMEGEALRALYNIADVFVMPNTPVEGDMEGFGIVTLEAAAAGLCVVASRVDGIPSAIINGKNGLLISPYDVDGYVETIASLLKDAERRKRFGERAREFTRRNYNWRKIAKQYLKVFQQVIHEHKGSR